MSWFKKDRPASAIVPPAEEGERKVRTEGLWQKCDGCRQIIWKRELESNSGVCPKCAFHFRIDAATRLKLLLDGDYESFDTNLTSSDPLDFVDSKPYSTRLTAMKQATSLSDALISARGKLAGRSVNVCVMDIRFIGGSMGCVVGEKIARAIDRSMAERSPLIVV